MFLTFYSSKYPEKKLFTKKNIKQRNCFQHIRMILKNHVTLKTVIAAENSALPSKE